MRTQDLFQDWETDDTTSNKKVVKSKTNQKPSKRHLSCDQKLVKAKIEEDFQSFLPMINWMLKTDLS